MPPPLVGPHPREVASCASVILKAIKLTPFEPIARAAPFTACVQVKVTMVLVLRQTHSRLLRQSGLWLSLLGLSLAACGGAPDEHPGPANFDPSIESAELASRDTQSDPGDPEASPDESSQAANCVDGETVACRVPLPTQGNVENCFIGVRTCVAGAWSNCHTP